MTNKKKLAVRGIALQNGNVFLVQRLNGKWEFPGGKSDDQEPSSALKREYKEETGLSITSLVPYRLLKQSKTGYKTMYFFVAVTGKIKLQRSEVKKGGWYSLNEARRMNLTTPSKRIMRSLW